MADWAIAGGRLGPLPKWAERLAATLAAEGERRRLWLPVAFGGGIALYFALRFEPPLWPGVLAVLLGIGCALLWRRHPAGFEAALLFAVFAAGFVLISETAAERRAPMLWRRLGPIAMTGRIADIDRAERGWRIILAPDALPGLAAEATPRRVRLHIPPSSDRLEPGDRVSLKGMLYPVPAPVLPGGRDLERDLYFARIGGVGYSFGAAHRLAGAAPDRGWREALRRLRAEMSARIVAVLPGSTGGIASALITGKRGAVAENVKQAFRDSGLAHLLAIAGLHLGLVGAFVFFAVRGGLALWPWFALRFPIKKIAAGAALAVLTGYLLISGAAIPTERAFVMNGLVFGAILVDRLRISMRICALAAAAVLLLDPASLVGVSFQMSFGAVVALIAVYETFGARIGQWVRRGPPGSRLLGYGMGIAVTTIVATLGTLPFSIYHFHHLALYSVVANVLAVPLSAMWTLPWGVVACLLMPFGLERFALIPMGWGIDLTIWIAQHVSGLPGNVWPMPRLPLGGLLLIAAGGLWLALWRQGWRRWGMLGIAAGLATLFLTRPPDIVLANGGHFLAVNAGGGNYFVRPAKGEPIARSFLASETGAVLLPWPAENAAAGGLTCKGDLCDFAADGHRVAILLGADALPLDCRGLDAIVAQVKAGFHCRAQMPVVDRIDSWRLGAVALWLDKGGVTLESANRLRGDRPWVPQPHRKGFTTAAGAFR